MKVSYNWLKEYIDGDMPPVKEVAQALTMHSFEIDSIEEINGDSVLDVKVLPNRAHDCLSHYGVASEVASVLNLKRKELLPKTNLQKADKIKSLDLDTKLSQRALMVYITDLNIGDSPDWLKEKLSVLGQKPINSVVDITNYLMLAFGQPLHAFDAQKVPQNKKGNFEMSIRQVKKEEKLVLLNGKEVALDSTMMVVSGSGVALDVAGIIGGKDTGVSKDTKEILLSLSHFDPVSIRKTAKVLGVRTDASQRFENGISPVLIDRVLPYALKLISEIAGGVVAGGVDTYPKPSKPKTISVTAEKISNILGTEIDSESIISLLARQNISAVDSGDGIIVNVPPERLDLEIPENIAEEVGRLFGYDKISPKPLEGRVTARVSIENYVVNSIRKVLIDLGYSEIYTYAFRRGGEVEIENPLAGDKNFLRSCLIDDMEESLNHNFKYMDLLGISEVKLFEIGKAFTSKGEFLHLSIGVKYPKSKKGIEPDEEISKVVQAIENHLGVSIGNLSIMGGIVEFDIGRIVKEVEVPEVYPDGLFETVTKDTSYKTISPYPFAVRDVAVFVPNEIEQSVVEDLIKKHFDSNVVRFSLFDKFAKPEKTSYAFRLVFQSQEKTLTDEEINAVMNPIYETLKMQEGFEIR